MIKIVLANGSVVTWDEKSYTDYKYDGKCFIIRNDGAWVGLYNLDHVISIEIDTDEAEHESKDCNKCAFAACLSQEEVDSLLNFLGK